MKTLPKLKPGVKPVQYAKPTLGNLVDTNPPLFMVDWSDGSASHMSIAFVDDSYLRIAILGELIVYRPDGQDNTVWRLPDANEEALNNASIMAQFLQFVGRMDYPLSTFVVDESELCYDHL